MLTLEKIKKDFTYIKAWTGDTSIYHSDFVFEDTGEFCDLYFSSENKLIRQEQVDVFNRFQLNFKDFIPEIDKFINSNLRFYESRNSELIERTKVAFSVVSVPYDTSKYDLILVCGKTYRSFLFFKKDIDIRVEFKDGKIKTIQRKKDTLEDND